MRIPHRAPRRAAISGAVLGAAVTLSAAAALAAETPRGQMASDLAARAREIHWPAGFAPERAELFAHNDAHMNAPCETVWRHVVDARTWPEWYPNAAGVRLLGGAKALGPAVRWRWRTFGLTIESRVHEFESGRRLTWFGGAPGGAPTFYHAWLLTPQAGGCRVVMDEAGIGAGAAAFRAADEGRMHRGHTLWLATLQWVSEGR
jgi:uncharacterized protein YndB with AHSA1/START domain